MVSKRCEKCGCFIGKKVHVCKEIWCKGLTKKTDERLRKRAKELEGVPKSEEHKINMKLSRLKGLKDGRIVPWNKGTKGLQKSPMKGKTLVEVYGKERAEEIKDKSKDTVIKKGQHLSPKTELKKGEKNPSWRGGISFEPYGLEFNNKLKREIRKRDNQICMVCGIHMEKLKRTLSVHHVNYNKRINIPQNLISLCVKCHTTTNAKRKYWQKFLQDLLSEKYEYKYSEDGKIIMEVKNGIKLFEKKRKKSISNGIHNNGPFIS